jgi:hypothetical protein
MQTQISRDRTKWLLLSFAFLATVINYLDRQTFVGDGTRAVGRISHRCATLFMLAYTVANGISGRLGIIPLISAWLVWTLPKTEELAPALF